jgi:Flp pilus assembly protein TadB
MRNEDIELQIEILAIQVRQQHISTLYSTMLSVEVSLMATIMVFYAGLYFYFGSPLFAWLTVLSVSFIIPIAITWSHYQKQLKKLEKELELLRKRYLFY